MFNRLRLDRIMVMSLWPRFLAHRAYLLNKTGHEGRRHVATESNDEDYR